MRKQTNIKTNNNKKTSKNHKQIYESINCREKTRTPQLDIILIIVVDFGVYVSFSRIHSFSLHIFSIVFLIRPMYGVRLKIVLISYLFSALYFEKMALNRKNQRFIYAQIHWCLFYRRHDHGCERIYIHKRPSFHCEPHSQKKKQGRKRKQEKHEVEMGNLINWPCARWSICMECSCLSINSCDLKLVKGAHQSDQWIDLIALFNEYHVIWWLPTRQVNVAFLDLNHIWPICSIKNLYSNGIFVARYGFLLDSICHTYIEPRSGEVKQVINSKPLLRMNT